MFTNVGGLKKPLSIVGGLLGVLWASLSPASQFLVCLMLADIVAGTARAIAEKRFAQATHFAGIKTKVGVVLMMVVAHLLETHILTGLKLGEFVVCFYATFEGLSFIRNVTALGLPVPPVFRQAIEAIERPATERVAEVPNLVGKAAGGK